MGILKFDFKNPIFEQEEQKSHSAYWTRILASAITVGYNNRKEISASPYVTQVITGDQIQSSRGFRVFKQRNPL